MSWSNQIGPVPASELENAIRTTPTFPFGGPDVVAQIDAACNAVCDLVDSGALDSTEDGGPHFQVSLSGHANPGHLPAQGYANDQINISISQVAPAPESAEAEETAEPDPEPEAELETPEEAEAA